MNPAEYIPKPAIFPEKLQRPGLPRSFVPRAHLLTGACEARVILVSAQAGAGKTTLVSEWLSVRDTAFCWYSLDDWDNDLQQFLAYLAAAVEAADESVSRALGQLLSAFSTIGFDSLLQAYLLQLHRLHDPFILVLDDYHLIRNEQIHQVLAQLLVHLPAALQLVLVTREDPPLPLARLRANKKLFELRIAALRFSTKEMKSFFDCQDTPSLTEGQLQLLAQRTEGWAAGLRMTALSLQDQTDIGGFVASFASNHRHVMDYLLEEVLERQPTDIRDFLLASSLPESFTAELCDAALSLAPGTSAAHIGHLIKTNCFILALDAGHRWYRYHALFRDLLRFRQMQKPPGETEKAHRAVAEWYEENRYGKEAVHHWFLAKDFERAAAIVERLWAEMDVLLQSDVWLEMARRLPMGILLRSPVLCAGFGWALLDQGDLSACGEWFARSEAWLDRCSGEARALLVCAEGLLVADETQFSLLPATLSSAYAYLAAATGDVAGTFRHTEEALRRIPVDQPYKRVVISMLLGIAHWRNGNLAEAEAVVADSLRGTRSHVNPLVENSYYMVLGELQIQQGAWEKAKDLLERTIADILERGRVPIVLPSLYLGLAKIALLRGNAAEAVALLEISKSYGQQAALMDWRYKWHVLRARVYGLEELFGPARESLAEGRAAFYANPLPDELSFDEVEDWLAQREVRSRISRGTGTDRQDKPVFARERANQLLADPLTLRELDVLALIGEGLSDRQIGERLYLSISTVKGYNRNLFGKLAVDRRTQAVAKARSLGLL